MDFQIIIVDDEAGARTAIRNMLALHCPDTAVAGEAGSVQGALDLLQNATPDLLLLDVEMEDGTGFDLLDRLPALNFSVVFTTAHDEFALRAFRYNAIDYLLKPVDPDELVAAVHKARQNTRVEQLQEQMAELLRATGSRALDRITLRTGKGLVFAPVNEITHLESYGNYSFVHLATGERHLDARNLKEYEDMLPHPGFFRTHQSFIVNTAFVHQLEKGDTGNVILRDGVQVPVSRRRRNLLEGIL